MTVMERMVHFWYQMALLSSTAKYTRISRAFRFDKKSAAGPASAYISASQAQEKAQQDRRSATNTPNNNHTYSRWAPIGVANSEPPSKKRLLTLHYCVNYDSDRVQVQVSTAQTMFVYYCCTV